MEFVPHTAGKHQSVTHEMAKEHVMQKLQMEPQHGPDTVTCLRDGVDEGIPMRDQSDKRKRSVVSPLRNNSTKRWLRTGVAWIVN